MMKVQDVQRFTRGALIVGILMILALTFGSNGSISFDHALVVGGLSATGLAAFCWIIIAFSKMIDDPL